MAWFRTKRRLVTWLVGIFLVAQLSGIIPRVVSAQPSAVTTITHATDQHTHEHAGHFPSHTHDNEQPNSGLADQCCALHLLAGVVPFVVTAVSAEPHVEPLLDVSTPNTGGIFPQRLDRPPRSLLSL